MCAGRTNFENRSLVDPRGAPARIVDEFERVLSDALDERPIQEFLSMNPSCLTPLAPPGGGYWCLDRPRLGAEFVPDFLLGSKTSIGTIWTAIEIEGPTERQLTRQGVPASKLAQALRQVRDWRGWLRDNITYARHQLGLTDIDGELSAFVVIGRRSTINPQQVQLYRGLSDNRTVVMSYDRLVDLMKRSSNLEAHSE